MSNTEPTTAHAVTPGDRSHLTVEDTGTTTDAADLIDDDQSSGGPSSGSTPGGGSSGTALPADDGSIGHVFDQTNGVVEGIEGESDGTAAGDELSPAERGEQNGALDGSEPLGGGTTPPSRTDGPA